MLKHRADYLIPICLMLLQLYLALGCDRQFQHVLPDGDSTFYYVTARNFALGRGLDDTILRDTLWHPPTVARPTGDFWSIGVPLLLGLVMRMVGTSETMVLFAVAVFSMLVPLALYCLARALDMEPVAAGLAGLLLVLQHFVRWFYVLPETHLFYSASLLFGLALAVRAGTPRRAVLAGMLLTVPYWFRTDGFIPLWAVLLTLLLRRKTRTAARMMFGSAIALAPIFLYNQVAFGHLVPPGRSCLPWMVSYQDRFFFDLDVTPARWLAQGAGPILMHVVQAFEGHVELLVQGLPWLLLVCAAYAWRRPELRQKLMPLGWCALLLMVVPCVMAPVVDAPHRFVCYSTPLICIMAACTIMNGKMAWAWRGALAVACVFAMLPYQWGDPSPFVRFPPGLPFRPVPRLVLRPTDVVLTHQCFWMAECLDVATVGCPLDSPEAVTHLIETYRPRYMLVHEPRSRLALYRDVTHMRDAPAHVVLRDGNDTWYEFDYAPKNSHGVLEPPPRGF